CVNELVQPQSCAGGEII
ncbi:amino ABC transporter, permease, 3-TM region, His/Glu/Gln/Arg/opine family domain protein, partial [Vibrio parahaemolyticus VPTS-2010_2]